MKKALFALFAVPLVLLPVILLATCDLYKLFPNADDKQSMACLSINFGGGSTSRALTTDLAQAKVDYYEVIFKAPNGLCYQAEWEDTDGTGSGSITIPVGNYTGVGGTNGAGAGAVMFAGIGDGKTLLAIGTISSIEDYYSPIINSDPLNAIIKSTTKSVTFMLTALENDVNDTNGSATDASSFQILSPTAYSTDSSTHAIYKEGGFPLFYIPAKSPFGYTADNEIRPLYTKDDNFITGQYLVNCTNALFASLKLSGDWSVSSPSSYNFLTHTGLTGVVGAPRKPEPNAVLADGEFIFHIDLSGASANTGYCLISIDAPVVYALSPTVKKAPSYANGSPITWHIRGGIDNANPDGGILEEWDQVEYNGKYGSLGGAVILAVGLTPPPSP